MKNINPQPELNDLLRRAHLRCTPTRLAILRVLYHAPHPLSRRDITQRLATHAPDKTTLYRTLHLFLERDLIHQAYIHDRTEFYELAHHCSPILCHPHFTCTACGRVRCLLDTRVSLPDNLPSGFHLTRQKTRLEGLCPDCNPPETATA